AVEEVQNIPVTWANSDDMSTLYGLYQQATVGDNNTGKKKQDVEGRARWSAWKCAAGLSSKEAEAQYIALVEKLKAKHEGASYASRDFYYRARESGSYHGTWPV
ncbi:hypothetical protein BCR43DRAFT_447332, partial [Syncephalastrum racemosum]